MSWRRRARLAVVVVAFLAPLGPAVAAAPAPGVEGWHAAWSRPQAIVAVGAGELAGGGRGPRPLVDQTVRVITRVTGGGSAVRIHLSNRFGATPVATGTTPLEIRAASVAIRTTGAGVDPATMAPLRFGGANGLTIAPGATVVSDPVDLAVDAGEDVAVSLHVASTPAPPAQVGALVTSYATAPLAGDRTAEAGGAAFTERTTSSPIVTAVDVASPTLRGTVAATGGSVTQGTGSHTDGHDDYPSWLSLRIRTELPVGQQRTVVNHGIGGTTAAAACSVPAFGPSVEERLADDTLGLSGLTHLLVYAGTNDLGFGCTGEQIIEAYRSIIRQAAGVGTAVLITTITPRAAYTPAQNVEREKVNAWVRGGGNCSGACHASLDFDRVVRDGNDPNRLDPALDSGDGVHPNARGYQLIAASIPLEALR